MTTRYSIASDFMRKNFTNTLLTFSVEHMKSDSLLMVRVLIHLYSSGKTKIDTRTSNWKVVGSVYQPFTYSFRINEDKLNRSAYYKVVLQVDGLSEDNRFYFNHIQLAEGRTSDYHQPETAIPKTPIKFSNNFYANLYTSGTENYLQVIRPYYNNMDTETITRSKVTVLAPHLANEDSIDSPSNIGLEFMNSNDQVIEILR